MLPVSAVHTYVPNVQNYSIFFSMCKNIFLHRAWIRSIIAEGSINQSFGSGSKVTEHVIPLRKELIKKNTSSLGIFWIRFVFSDPGFYIGFDQRFDKSGYGF